jgi:hypothetical protein
MVELAIAWLLSEPAGGQRHRRRDQRRAVAQNAAAAGKTGISIGQDGIGPAARGEVQPWRTNLSKIGGVSREVLLPPLGAVRLRKKCSSAFPFSIWKYQSCGSPQRVHLRPVCLNS